MRCVRNAISVAMVAVCVLWTGGAHAQSADGLMVIDSRHFARVTGDRIVIYELDPARGYQLKVVNTVILDAEGEIIGQFRPSEPPAVPPGKPVIPEPTAPAPPARVRPAPPTAPSTPGLEARQATPDAALARR